jgi:hypothetical protein
MKPNETGETEEGWEYHKAPDNIKSLERIISKAKDFEKLNEVSDLLGKLADAFSGKKI